MSAPLVLVSGTGTGIGKTHATSALLRAWGRFLAERGTVTGAIVGVKPVESGVCGDEVSDVERLRSASSFHVKQSAPPYALRDPISPHLAAERAGITLQLGPIVAYVDTVRREVAGLAVELAGGMFSPLAPNLSNADVARALAPATLLLVAPDRLGVLHDVAATSRAACAAGVIISGIVLMAPDREDASTGTNARELRHVTPLPVLAVLPRASETELSLRTDMVNIVLQLERGREPTVYTR